VKILIVKLSAIGDVIHTLPAVNALRRHDPHAHITWLVEEDAAPLVMGHRAVDRVLVSKRKRWLRALAGPGRKAALQEMGAFIRALRDTRYDLVLDFQALLKSGVLIALARGRRKVGFGRGMQHMEHSYIFLNEKIPPVSMEIHALERGLLLIEALGVARGEIVYDLPIGESAREAAAVFLARGGIHPNRPMVAVNPVAKWETKLWPPRRFAALADGLVRRCGVQIVFTGSTADRPLVARILAAMAAPALNLAGRTTLKTLAALYQRCDLLVTTDTGPMHLGCAAGLPVVAIFGPTAPWRTGPFGRGHTVVRRKLACSPCFKRICPLGTGACLRGLPVQPVFAAVRRRLADKCTLGQTSP